MLASQGYKHAPGPVLATHVEQDVGVSGVELSVRLLLHGLDLQFLRRGSLRSIVS
jgi:hypothetical protein